jgi:peptidoglycan/xylan/chitin deacetylase (PgdA/CDA1 family)
MRTGPTTRAALLALAALGCACSPAAPLDGVLRRLAQRDPEVLYYVPTEASAVALTIDDGPDPESTPRILEVLARHGARATFFVITSRIPGNEDLLKRMLEAGHELANHATADAPSVDLSRQDFERDLLDAHESLSRFTEPRWFRPGSGWVDDEMLEVLATQGYRCALGSVYPFDPQIRSAWLASRYILWRSRPGSIIILHDHGNRGRRTVTTLETVLPRLARRNLRVLTLSELVELQQPAP